MMRKAISNFVLLPLFSLGLLMGLSGCGRSSEAPAATPLPTETLPPLAPGTTVIVDICQENPRHPACIGLQEPTPTAQGSNAEPWQTFIDPLGRFAFTYPTGWYTMTVTPDPSDGVRVMDAPDLQESTRWVSLQVFQNPHRASVQVWVAEHGVGWPGKVTEQKEDWINGVPVLRQRLENSDPNMGGPYIYALIWYPHEDLILRWTAWPGEQAETLKLLEQMVSSFRKP
ncbi:MAG: hypothetical protein N2508_03980 [Anaerolineae bacterium]|nr:hypothetical protein [Anaerolineae bacterium]